MKKTRRNYNPGPGSSRFIRLPFGPRIAKSTFFGSLAILLVLGAGAALTSILLFRDAAEDRQRVADTNARISAGRPETVVVDPVTTVAERHWSAMTDELLDQPALARGTDNPTLRRILDAHVKAMGGWAAWNKVESLRLTGTIERDGAEVDFCIIKKRPGQIRATFTVPLPGRVDEGLQVIRASNGEEAWTGTRIAGDQTIQKKELRGADAEETHADAGVLPKLIGLWQSGAELALLETTEVDGAEAYVIEARTKGDSSTDPLTFYLARSDYRVLKYTKGNANPSTTRLSDFKNVGGVLFPMTSVITAEKTGRSIITTRSIDVDVGVHQAYFAADNDSRNNLN